MLAHDDLVDAASIYIAAKAYEPTTAHITVCEIVPCQVLNLRLKKKKEFKEEDQHTYFH